MLFFKVFGIIFTCLMLIGGLSAVCIFFTHKYNVLGVFLSVILISAFFAGVVYLIESRG